MTRTHARALTARVCGIVRLAAGDARSIDIVKKKPANRAGKGFREESARMTERQGSLVDSAATGKIV